MRVMTFEEWLDVNQDLVDDLLNSEGIHPSGVPYRSLINVGIEDEPHLLSEYLRPMYDEQRQKDEANLEAWNRAILEVTS